MMKKTSTGRGFTLIELLVVMAILAVLIGMAIAAVAYAMRQSRNTQRQTAMNNVSRALTAFYTANTRYPLPSDINSTVKMQGMVFGDTVPPDPWISTYMESSLELPATTRMYYRSDGAIYTICVTQEVMGSNNPSYVCTGTGVGSEGGTPTDWPSRELPVGNACVGCCGGSAQGFCGNWDATNSFFRTCTNCT